MDIVIWLLYAIFGYLIYSVVKGNAKISKRNELKFDEEAVRIPVHLCTACHSDEEDLTFEEMESYSQKDVTYKTIKWDDIKSWEYQVVTHMNFNDTVWLRIITASERISVTDVHLRKMKRYFKRYAKEKQIVSFSNKIEAWGIILSFAVNIAFAYIIFLGKL